MVHDATVQNDINYFCQKCIKIPTVKDNCTLKVHFSSMSTFPLPSFINISIFLMSMNCETLSIINVFCFIWSCGTCISEYSESRFDFTVHCLDDFLHMQFKFTESRLSVSHHRQQYDNKPRDKLSVITCILCVLTTTQF